jgi:hypothetical protein
MLAPVQMREAESGPGPPNPQWACACRCWCAQVLARVQGKVFSWNFTQQSHCLGLIKVVWTGRDYHEPILWLCESLEKVAPLGTSGTGLSWWGSFSRCVQPPLLPLLSLSIGCLCTELSTYSHTQGSKRWDCLVIPAKAMEEKKAVFPHLLTNTEGVSMTVFSPYSSLTHNRTLWWPDVWKSSPH